MPEKALATLLACRGSHAAARPSDVRNSLAYHVTVHSLEGRAGLKGIERFALAIEHSLAGHLPFARCVQASEKRRREGSTASSIERAVADWLESDLNPVVQSVRRLKCAASVIAGYNAYNRSAPLAIRTKVAIDATAGASARRELLGVEQDVEGSRIAALAILERLVACAATNAKLQSPPPVKKLSDVARYLAIERSVAAEAALVLESDSGMSMPALARALGCSVRTLERCLREEGITARTLKCSVRLVRATERLGGPGTLTEIAHEEGFSDLAHMSRSFQAACGVAPSVLRPILVGDA